MTIIAIGYADGAAPPVLAKIASPTQAFNDYTFAHTDLRDTLQELLGDGETTGLGGL